MPIRLLAIVTDWPFTRQYRLLVEIAAEHREAEMERLPLRDFSQKSSERMQLSISVRS